MQVRFYVFSQIFITVCERKTNQKPWTEEEKNDSEMAAAIRGIKKQVNRVIREIVGVFFSFIVIFHSKLLGQFTIHNKCIDTCRVQSQWPRNPQTERIPCVPRSGGGARSHCFSHGEM